MKITIEIKPNSQSENIKQDTSANKLQIRKIDEITDSKAVFQHSIIFLSKANSTMEICELKLFQEYEIEDWEKIYFQNNNHKYSLSVEYELINDIEELPPNSFF